MVVLGDCRSAPIRPALIGTFHGCCRTILLMPSIFLMPSTPSDSTSRRRLLLYCASTLALLAGAGCKRSAPATCPASNLSSDELNVRTVLGYVDSSVDAAKTCAKCQQYVPADPCGSCKVVNGAIHPDGYCRAFVAL